MPNNHTSNQCVCLDLNNPMFQDTLFALQKNDRLTVVDTLKKQRQLTWRQVYAYKGVRWEKIASIKPPQGISAIYSLRITLCCRATAFHEGDFIRFLTISPDHDATYGKK